MHPSCPGTISTDDMVFFFFQAEDGIRDLYVTGVQTCALPIFRLVLVERDSETPGELVQVRELAVALVVGEEHEHAPVLHPGRSEEHTSELQSRRDLVCRLLLEKKKKKITKTYEK